MALDYNSLITDIQIITADYSLQLVDALPNIVSRAELTVTKDLDTLAAVQSYLSDPLGEGSYIINKPDSYIGVLQFSAIEADNTYIVLDKRTLGYVRYYYPNTSVTGTPKFYADLDNQAWLIAPSLDTAYTFEVQYIMNLSGLTTGNQTTWLVLNQYELLLKACLREASVFQKDDEMYKIHDADYKALLPNAKKQCLQYRIDLSTMRV